MFTTLHKILVATLFTITIGGSIGSSAFAHEFKVGDLKIDHPHARATVAGAPVSGGYMTITNMGDEDDRLVSASTDFAGKTEIHEMAMDGDVMKMRQLADGLTIPAGETIILKPGGLHIMFMGLKEQLKKDEKRKATLTFEKSGTIEVNFAVEDTMTIMKNAKAAGAKMMDHSTMDHGKMKHEDMDHSGHKKHKHGEHKKAE